MMLFFFLFLFDIIIVDLRISTNIKSINEFKSKKKYIYKQEREQVNIPKKK